MIWAQLLSLAALWIVASFAPGFLFVRRFKWSPGERLCAAVGLSLFLLYLASFGVFLAGARGWGDWVISAASVAAGVWCRRDWTRLLKRHDVRRMLWVLLAMLAWGTACLGLVRHYAGGVWGGDWFLHYNKVGVFLHGLPADMKLVREEVIDRPSMMNVVTAYFCSQVGFRFETFETVFCWLNILPVLPCCLLAGMFARRGGRRLWVVAGMLACLPILWMNATYTWTKLLSAFYALLGIYLYRRAVIKGDRGRMLAAFASFAVGILVHYVALPYGVFTFGHYLLMVWRRRKKPWEELGLIVSCGAAILLTWFGWAAMRYGLGEMAVANNTLRHARQETGYQVFMKMAHNAVWNVMPHPFLYSAGYYVQPSRLGYVRDYMFLLYQVNLTFLTGTGTGLAAAWGTYQRLRSRAPAATAPDPAGRWWALAGGIIGVVLAYPPSTRNVIFDLFPKMWMMALVVGGCAWGVWWGGRVVRGRERGVGEGVWYWRGLIAFLPVAAALALDVPSDYGSGHIFFHAWALMGVTLAAVMVWDWPLWARCGVGLGMAVDFALGVWLHFHLERRVFSFLPDGQINRNGLHVQAGENWREKVNRGFVFLGDHLTPVANVLEGLLIVGAVVAIGYVIWGAKRRGILDRGRGVDKINA